MQPLSSSFKRKKKLVEDIQQRKVVRVRGALKQPITAGWTRSIDLGYG